ncbi:MAG: hypothetical protein E6Q32_10910 [Neisseriales bacterium]|jgi:type IV secretory pathway protease TraF|nr:MAG: hypothetical protein E6Q32_10910 [Neisseriales bacterium]
MKKFNLANLQQALQNKNVIVRIIISWILIIGVYTVTRFYQIQINASTSLPQTYWFVHVGDKTLHTGDYVVAKFHDQRMVNPDDYEFVVKQIAGMPEDIIAAHKMTVQMNLKNHLWITWIYDINGQSFFVYNRLRRNVFTPLAESNIVIPNNCYFTHGTQQPTFDSRYKEFGFICESQIYGKAYPIFD